MVADTSNTHPEPYSPGRQTQNLSYIPKIIIQMQWEKKPRTYTLWKKVAIANESSSEQKISSRTCCCNEVPDSCTVLEVRCDIVWFGSAQGWKSGSRGKVFWIKHRVLRQKIPATNMWSRKNIPPAAAPSFDVSCSLLSIPVTSSRGYCASNALSGSK